MTAVGAALTYVQNKAYQHILGFLANTGVGPTQEELASSMGYSSAQSSRDLLGVLEKKGYIRRLGKGRNRGILLAGPAKVHRGQGGISVVPGRPMNSQETMILAGELMASVGNKEMSHASCAG